MYFPPKEETLMQTLLHSLPNAALILPLSFPSSLWPGGSLILWRKDLPLHGWDFDPKTKCLDKSYLVV